MTTTSNRYFTDLNTAYKSSAGTKAECPSMSQNYAGASPSPEICRHFGIFDYTDYSGHPVIADEEGREGDTTSSRKGKPRFPETLFKMLQDEANNDREYIVSFKSHGRCFIVHKINEFVETILPKYFHQSSYASFQRQLSLYGFKRLTKGRDAGSYYHELFLRGRPDLLKKVVRVRQQTVGKSYQKPLSQPDFYLMRPVEAACPMVSIKCRGSAVESIAHCYNTDGLTETQTQRGAAIPPTEDVASIVTNDDEMTCQSWKPSKKGTRHRPLKFPGYLRNALTFQQQGYKVPQPADPTAVEGKKHSLSYRDLKPPRDSVAPWNSFNYNHGVGDNHHKGVIACSMGRSNLGRDDITITFGPLCLL